MTKGTSDDRNSLPNLVVYGNLDGKEIIAINADSMEVHSTIPLTNSE